MTDESTMGERMSQRDDVVLQAMDQLEHRMNVGFDRMDARFKQIAESFRALTERMDRGFAQMEAGRLEDRKLLFDILGNHEGRIARLEGESRPSS